MPVLLAGSSFTCWAPPGLSTLLGASWTGVGRKRAGAETRSPKGHNGNPQLFIVDLARNLGWSYFPSDRKWHSWLCTPVLTQSVAEMKAGHLIAMHDLKALVDSSQVVALELLNALIVAILASKA